MQPQTKYNVSELIAYLLPGSILVIIVYYFWVGMPQTFTDIKDDKIRLAVEVLLYFGASLAGGHICSVWDRWILRPILHSIAGNPRTAILNSKGTKFYSTEIKLAIKSKFHKIFNLDMNNQAIRNAVPRLIRSYVLEHSSSIPVIRNNIVRVRSMAGNLSLPLIILSFLCCIDRQYTLCLLLLLACCALLIKQVDLDIREWKEVYLGFLCVDG
jgi:hypothetical protein